MGCNCGGGGVPARLGGAEVTREPRSGDWEVTYPDGRRKVFSGRSARREAQRLAISTGGTARRHP